MTTTRLRLPLLFVLSLHFDAGVQAQDGPPPPGSLKDITQCVPEGDAVIITTGREAAARRYKYAWEPAIDALCNARGFAISAPARATTVPAPPAAASPAPMAAAPAQAASSAQAAAAPVPTPGSDAKTSTGAPAEFPAGASSLSADAVTRTVAGKSFAVRLHNGGNWRLQYDANGYVYVNVGGGPNASGRWRAEDGRLCSEIRGGPSSCNEVRALGDRLFLRRENGEVIALEQR